MQHVGVFTMALHMAEQMWGLGKPRVKIKNPKSIIMSKYIAWLYKKPTSEKAIHQKFRWTNSRLVDGWLRCSLHLGVHPDRRAQTLWFWTWTSGITERERETFWKATVRDVLVHIVTQSGRSYWCVPWQEYLIHIYTFCNTYHNCEKRRCWTQVNSSQNHLVAFRVAWN